MNYMESYTDAEEIKRLIPIYEKTEAHNMVNALKERLEELGELPTIEEVLQDGEEIPVEEAKVFAKELATPLEEPDLTYINPDAVPPKPKKEYNAKALYEMKEAGLTWKEVTKATGVKTPWVKAAIYRKDNDLPKV